MAYQSNLSEKKQKSPSELTKGNSELQIFQCFNFLIYHQRTSNLEGRDFIIFIDQRKTVFSKPSNQRVSWI